jgi:hypothetical protein
MTNSFFQSFLFIVCTTTVSIQAFVPSAGIGGPVRNFKLAMSSTSTVAPPSWDELKTESASQAVGTALNDEVEKRKEGKGSAHVQSKLRLFASDEKPKITLYRDHAGCKFSKVHMKCNKTIYEYTYFCKDLQKKRWYTSSSILYIV